MSRELAESLIENAPVNVDGGLIWHARLLCTRCGETGNIQDLGYLFNWIERHRICESLRKVAKPSQERDA